MICVILRVINMGKYWKKNYFNVEKIIEKMINMKKDNKKWRQNEKNMDTYIKNKFRPWTLTEYSRRISAEHSG